AGGTIPHAVRGESETNIIPHALRALAAGKSEKIPRSARAESAKGYSVRSQRVKPAEIWNAVRPELAIRHTPCGGFWQPGWLHSASIVPPPSFCSPPANRGRSSVRVG